MLTTKQHELLVFIDKHLRQTGCSPSFEEMKEALDLRSKSGIHRLITALEERGFLKRHKHRARALEVVRLSDDLDPPTREIPKFAPTVIQGDFTGKLPGVRAAAAAEAVTLPLYGRIAAGLPIEALQEHDEEIEVPASLVGWRAFRPDGRGQFHDRCGILDGDTVSSARAKPPRPGRSLWR